MTSGSSNSSDVGYTQFDTGPLSWVIGEVREALSNAGKLLSDAVTQDAESQATTLHHSKSYLHQAHGALQIVEVEGVSLITETVEELVDRIQAGKLEITHATAEVLSDAFYAVIRYLEDLLAGSQQQPVRLFPYYRALLEIKGSERIHPADLFFPSLSIQEKIPELELRGAPKSVNYSAIRQRFEKLLLTVLTSKALDAKNTALVGMAELIKEIEQAQSSVSTKAFWLVMRAFAEVTSSAHQKDERHVKQIWGRINLQIRRLVDGNASIPERLLRDALFFIAQVDHPSPFVEQIRKAYQLENHVPADYDQRKYGQIAAHVLATAKEQLANVKNLWGRIANGDPNLAEKFTQKMKDLAESGSQLDSQPLSKLLRELSGISGHVAQAKQQDKIGLELATCLLFIENSFDQITHLPSNFAERANEISGRLLGFVSGESPTDQATWMGDISREVQQRQTMEALVGEMQLSLRQAEKALDEHFRDTSNLNILDSVDNTLAQIGGALAMLDQDDATLALQHTRELVRQFGLEDQQSGIDEKHRQVAQNIGALSFFIDTLHSQPELAKKRFTFDLTSGLLRTNLLEKKLEKELLPSDDVLSSDVKTNHLTAEQDLVVQQKESERLAASLAEAPSNVDLQAQLKDSLDSERSFAALLDDTQAISRVNIAIEILEQSDFKESPTGLSDIIAATTPVQIPAVMSPPIELPVNDAAIDAELLEIFLMEADEVLGAVNENIPLSKHDPSNQEYLIRLRRSFHTLKGSGRMVGLTVFGEVSWNIEQVMNLWLSESRSGMEPLYALLEYTSKELLVWVDELKNEGGSARDGEAIIAAAIQVRDGGGFSINVQDQSSDKNHAFLRETDNLTAPVELDLLSVGSLDSFALAEPDATAPALETSFDTLSETHSAEVHNVELLPEAIDISSADVVLNDDMQVVGQTHHELDDALLHQEFKNIQNTDHWSEEDDKSILTASLVAVESNPSIETAKIIEFPDFSMPTMATDDSTKKIGDIEISLPLHTIYMAETDEIVRFLAQDFAEWRHEPMREVSRHAVHASHSLSGSSATVGLFAAQELAHNLENVLQRLERHPVVLEAVEFNLLDEVVEHVKLMLQKFALSEMAEHVPAMIQKLGKLLEAVIARSNVGDDEEFITSTNEIVNPVLHEELEIKNLIEPILENNLSNAMTASSTTEVILEALELTPELEDQQEELIIAKDHDDSDAIKETPTPTVYVAPSALVSNPDMGSAAPEIAIEGKINDEIDTDLLPVFIEEGNDLLPMVGQLLRSWQQHPQDQAIPQSILRLMHTIKGSARMAGAMQLGQHTHDMETRIENLMHTGGAIRQSLLDDLLARHDYSTQLFERLQNPHVVVEPVPVADLTVAQEINQFQESHEFVESKQDESTPVVVDRHVISTNAPRVAPVVQPISAANVPLVRVRADILDRLVNQAGEVSISRSKLENEVDTLRASLSELTENVSRLRAQLREIEIQAETQITSRMAMSGDREFDPLEFDRFTRLQELTRMMAESVSDVATVQVSLNRTIDGASNDLHTQARLTRELQQDLMRVRMISFSSVSERLYRIARQTAKEGDKRVNLDIRGTSVEIDRSVLEKMVGPFEHMLRNAIVHGIEERQARVARGKAEVGELLIEIRQEGNEVVIHFTDDGQGLNIARIREKAKAIGLLSDDRPVSDFEVSDLIFEPGFSTAQEITELAGRGVGMDVVRSEAASLGGRVSVTSVEGQGAHFTIHLPLTLAVTQVVILNAGGKTYAVPSVLVEQVQQLKSAMLANAYNDGAILWQGVRVPLHYLPSMLGDKEVSPETQQYTPILIMKSDNVRVAIHVDQILGNREVVVKNVGPQLARMIGIAGATVLGSGDIVLILNPVPLAQKLEHELAKMPEIIVSDTPQDLGAIAELSTPVKSTSPVQGLRSHHIVMVVDDSLTVRRVTQRLLVREGYQVVLAKDGIDALEQLQSITPDVMLVDIEMPRMDGFDLTRNVRSDSRTQHVPIIMITSRTADKHRNYAAELGVNEYFGKPYREDDLLAAITRFVSKEVVLN